MVAQSQLTNTADSAFVVVVVGMVVWLRYVVLQTRPRKHHIHHHSGATNQFAGAQGRQKPFLGDNFYDIQVVEMTVEVFQCYLPLIVVILYQGDPIPVLHPKPPLPTAATN